jgi:hypothetical protein
LSYGEEVLEVAGVLKDTFEWLGLAGVDAGVDEVLLAGGFEADETGRVDAISEIDTEGADGGFITNPKADGVNHVIEILDVALRLPEGKMAHVGIDVAGVVEKDTADVFSD